MIGPEPMTAGVSKVFVGLRSAYFDSVQRRCHSGNHGRRCAVRSPARRDEDWVKRAKVMQRATRTKKAVELTEHRRFGWTGYSGE
jgi:hypothetical protein